MATSDADVKVIQFSGQTPRKSDGICVQFGIDGCEPFFWGYRSERLWNGWSTPDFRPEVIDVMMKHFNDPHETILRWSGSTLVVTEPGTDDPVEIEPDEAGRYTFDGWTWAEAPEDTRPI